MEKCFNGKDHDFDSLEESEYCANGCGEKWAIYEIKKLREENTKSKQQIEKMKCCFNCKNLSIKPAICRLSHEFTSLESICSKYEFK